jgi:hypothetical protein
MQGGATGPMLVVARTHDHRTEQIVLKLRHPGTTFGNSGGTSLACELICSVVARSVGIRVPDYGIAQVEQAFASSVREPAAATRLLNNIGLNFATVLITPTPQSWNPKCTSLSLDLRQSVEDVLSFDASVINGDRTAAKPNLLWDGGDTIHAIDHSLACPVHAWSATQIAASPEFPDGNIQAHCGYEYLRKTGREFEDLQNKWTANLDRAFWAELRTHIPAQWEENPGDLDRIFDFLETRTIRFPDMRTSLKRLIQ